MQPITNIIAKKGPRGPFPVISKDRLSARTVAPHDDGAQHLPVRHLFNDLALVQNRIVNDIQVGDGLEADQFPNADQGFIALDLEIPRDIFQSLQPR